MSVQTALGARHQNPPPPPPPPPLPRTYTPGIASRKSNVAGLALRKRFTCFSRLPLEIRLLIWEAVLPGPRLVNMRQRPVRKTFLDYKEEMGHEWPLLEDDTEDAQGSHELDDVRNAAARARDDISRSINTAGNVPIPFYEAHLLGIDSNYPPPSIMVVCRESCSVVLHHYTKSFSCMGSVPQTYFDFTRDTLYLHIDSFAYYRGDGIMTLDMVLDGLNGHSKITDSENLGRVQKLAITIPMHYSSRAQTEFLKSILVVFEGAKEISIIVDDQTVHFSAYGIHHPVDIDEQCIVNPVSFGKALIEYYRCRDDILSGKMRQLHIPITPEAKQVTSIVDTLRAQWKSSTTTEARQFPNIQPKILINPIDSRDLNRAVSLYNAALAHHEQKLREGREAAGICSDDDLSDDDF
ncbi:hypothetical protein VTL71DRAFT_6754 [Oculimacula yallundae]|uniref:2EXR domain-containing protein n=1 Tax=Oculimacula yallundae TaxID=86028 RepID=A0ABR4BXX0_9HELO